MLALALQKAFYVVEHDPLLTLLLLQLMMGIWENEMLWC